MSTKSKNKQIETMLSKRKQMSQETQVIEAQNLISDIKSVDVDSAAKQVLIQINKGRSRSLIIQNINRIAAVLFIPVLLVSVWSLFIYAPQIKNSLLARQQVTSPTGIRTQIKLSDGTKVWLNSESTIKFPVPFIGNLRTVELEGEAYFEVEENKERPFVVNSGKAKVKVLGTSFNFKSYTDTKNVELVLKEGSVAFESNYNQNSQEVKLVPGNRVIVSKKTGELNLSNVRVNKYIAWHDNKLVLDESSIQELARILKEWYNVDVRIQDKALLTSNYRFTTTFENEPLEQVLELLEYSSPIDIKYKPSRFDIKTKEFSKPQVIIFSKK